MTALFLLFLEFPGAVQAPLEKVKKGQKGQFRPIFREPQGRADTPLKHPFVTPPVAAAEKKTVGGFFSSFSPLRRLRGLGNRSQMFFEFLGGGLIDPAEAGPTIV